jgi:hypothetical protein
LKNVTNNAQDFLNNDDENKKNFVDKRPVDVQLHEIDDILGFFIFIFLTIYYYYFFYCYYYYYYKNKKNEIKKKELTKTNQ